MQQYETFIFEDYRFLPEEGKIELKYSLDGDQTFTEKVLLPKKYTASIISPQLDNALFALHILGGVSYYKTCCPKKIEVRSGELTKEQAKFFNTVYTKGLGEFFYHNKIDFHGLINFPATTSTPHSPLSTLHSQPNHALVPIGGGKDSVVSIEMLEEAGNEMTLFRLGKHPLIERLVEEAGLPPVYYAERHLSPALFRLNEEGALNGHVPISAYVSCLSVIVALLEGMDRVVMSNEQSANIGNVEYLGEEINHQWSKSEEFERMFQEYIHHFIAPNLHYESLLRDLNELQVAKIFCDHEKYFQTTTSCNRNWKLLKDEEACHERGPKGRVEWCGECPKCAFVFALYAAFLPKEKLLSIFGDNFFDRKELEGEYKQLLGLEGFKPFECVGTPEETKEAFELAHKRGDLDDTLAMQLFLNAYAHS